MNTPHKTMAEIRDAEWEKYKEENPPKGQAKFYYIDNMEYFKAGFDCRDKLDNEALKLAVEALKDSCEELEFRMEKNQEVTPSGDSGKHDKIISAGFGILLRAREALAKIKSLRGEV